MSEDKVKKTKRNTKKSMKGGESETVAVYDNNSKNFAHIEPVQAKPLEVKVYNNAFERALKAFRALVQKERVLSAYKDKQVYEKPSDRNRRKKNESKRKQMENDLYANKERKVNKKPFKNKDSE